MPGALFAKNCELGISHVTPIDIQNLDKHYIKEIIVLKKALLVKN